MCGCRKGFRLVPLHRRCVEWCVVLSSSIVYAAHRYGRLRKLIFLLIPGHACAMKTVLMTTAHGMSFTGSTVSYLILILRSLHVTTLWLCLLILSSLTLATMCLAFSPKHHLHSCHFLNWGVPLCVRSCEFIAKVSLLQMSDTIVPLCRKLSLRLIWVWVLVCFAMVLIAQAAVVSQGCCLRGLLKCTQIWPGWVSLSLASEIWVTPSNVTLAECLLWRYSLLPFLA